MPNGTPRTAESAESLLVTHHTSLITLALGGRRCREARRCSNGHPCADGHHGRWPDEIRSHTLTEGQGSPACHD